MESLYCTRKFSFIYNGIADKNSNSNYDIEEL